MTVGQRNICDPRSTLAQKQRHGESLLCVHRTNRCELSVAADENHTTVRKTRELICQWSMVLRLVRGCCGRSAEHQPLAALDSTIL